MKGVKCLGPGFVFCVICDGDRSEETTMYSFVKGTESTACHMQTNPLQLRLFTVWILKCVKGT